MGKRKTVRHHVQAADKKMITAVEQSNRQITELLHKLDLTDEERTSADIISMKLLREAVAQFAAARNEAKKHGVHLRIRVTQAALAAALQGIMTYPVEGGE
jgi:alpha-D-ribose 1-methylphosphonate 5-triphosphate diphosphatase PhnM